MLIIVAGSLASPLTVSQPFRNQGKWHGQQIIPTQALKSIAQEGSREAFARSPYINMKGWSYRAMWWHTGNEHGAFAARGVHG